MKEILFLFVLVVLASLISINDIFAETMNSISVTTDKTSYEDGDIVLVTGEVRELLSGIPVSLRVIAPNGNPVILDQLDVGSDKKFSIELIAGGENMKAVGTYLIQVIYGTESRSAETTFVFGDSDYVNDTTSPTDTDGDGISDSIDQCPTQTETFNGFEDLDGCPDISPKSYVPTWFKHDVRWWVEGKISDSDFVAVSEYLIQEKVIVLRYELSKKTVPSEIPSWIKNNAKWWYEGQIDDDAFIQGMEFMVKEKILGSSTQKKSLLSNFIQTQTESDQYGFKVIFTNTDSKSHTITFGSPMHGHDEKFNSSLLSPQQTTEIHLTEIGSFDYFCMIHPWESDVLSVTSSDLTMFYEEKIRQEERQEERQRLDEYDRQQKESEQIASETVIMNPKDVQNYEFYDINTECQLKYFFFVHASEIINMIIQNEQRVEQEYNARASQKGDSSLLSEIMAEIIMEQYSINPILKDTVIITSSGELSQVEGQQIQQGTHPCEEEFRLYSSDYVNNVPIMTKTLFTDSPINGAEIGQWVKYQVEINTDSNEKRSDFNRQFSNSLDGVNFDWDDVEWLKREVIDISGNKTIIQNEFKVKDKTSLFINTLTYDFPTYGILESFIPINVEKGNIIFLDGVIGNLNVVDFQKKNYGGKNIDVIYVTASVKFNQADETVENNIETYYDKKTGMLLEGQLYMRSTLSTDSFEFSYHIKAIDFHIPSTMAFEPTCGQGTELVNGICQVIKTEEKSNGGGCLIATATYGSELAPQVQQLRELRNNSLLQTESGTLFMTGFNQFYYSFSPTVSDWERESPAFKEFVKITLTPMISSLSILNYVDMNSEESVLGYGISLIILNLGMYLVAPAVIIHIIRKKL